MVRSGHDPQGLNRFVDVATGVGVMPIPSRLGSCPSIYAVDPLLEAADLAVAQAVIASVLARC
jgi:hypothetical protein